MHHNIQNHTDDSMSLQLQPQEVEVFYVLPAIRRELAKEMKRQGKSQRDIAGMLGVTDAAVSQYISQKRATVKLPKKLQDSIKKAASKINNRESMLLETQKLLRETKKDRFICKLHGQVADLPKGCDVCFNRDGK
jgi:predicted transcriptional regulator